MTKIKENVLKRYVLYFLIAIFTFLSFVVTDSVYASEHLEHEYDENGLCKECYSAEAAMQDEEGRYIINNAGNLLWFSDFVNSSLQNRAANAVLCSDIDMTEALSHHSFTPIAKTEIYLLDGKGADVGYTGTFDGGGKVISNLVISPELSEGCSFGLFGTLSGTVKRLGISDLALCATNTSSDEAGVLGGIAGQVLSDGVITDCYVANSVVACYGNYSDIAVGGIAGALLGGEIVNCHTYGTEYVGDSSVSGEFVGFGSTLDESLVGTVTNCYGSSFNYCGEYYPCELLNCGRFGNYPILVVGLLGDEWGFLVGKDTYPVLRNEENRLFYGYRGCEYKKSHHNDAENNNSSRVKHSPENVSLVAEGDSLSLKCEYCGAELYAKIEASDTRYNEKEYSAAKAVYEDTDGYFEDAINSHLRISYNTKDGKAPKEAGSYLAYLGSGEEKAEKAFSITKISLTDIEISDMRLIYDGTQKSVDVRIFADGLGTVAELNGDGSPNYKLTFSNNVSAGQALVTAEGVGNFCGTVTASFDIERCSLKAAEISGEIKSAHLIYNGKEQRPALTVSLDGRVLEENIDYTVSYNGNINAGEALAVVSGIGNYKDTRAFAFTIHKQNVEICIVPRLVEIYTGQGIPEIFDYLIFGIDEEKPALSGETLKVNASLPSDSKTAGIWELVLEGEIGLLNYNVTHADKGISYLVIKDKEAEACIHSFLPEYEWQIEGEIQKCKLSSVCQSCKTTEYSVTVDAVLQNYKDSDCENKGEATYVAHFDFLELSKEKTVEIAPKGHSWSAWSDADCSEDKRERSCAVCGAYETEDIPKEPDSPEQSPEQSPEENPEVSPPEKDNPPSNNEDGKEKPKALPIILVISALVLTIGFALWSILKKRP